MPQPKRPPTAQMDAARSESNGHKTLTFNGQDFNVPAVLPFTFAAFIQGGEILNAIRGLLADPADVPRFMEAARGLGLEEAMEALGAATDAAYGVNQGD